MSRYRIDSIRDLHLILVPGNHEWRPCFVDQNGIGFVHQGHREGPVNLVLRIESQLIAKVIESNLIRGGVGHVTRVSALAFLGMHALLNASSRESQELIDRPHPLRIAPGEIVVGSHDMNAAFLLPMPDDGRNRRQRLSFAGLHLGDLPVGQGQGALQLNVEHHQTQDASRNNRRHCNRFQQIPRSAAGIAQCLVTDTREFSPPQIDPADSVFG